MRIVSIILTILLILSCSKYTVQVANPRGSFHDGEYHNGHFYPYPPNMNKIVPNTPLPRQKKERIILSPAPPIKKDSKIGLNPF
jgi:hypothetical protein